MQDRFQFRVWKGKENRMVYNVTHLNPLLLDPRINKENVHNVLLQCTGLKDRNGELIYEGDIVVYKGTLPEETAKVVPINKKFEPIKFAVKFEHRVLESGFGICKDTADFSEVIGNIYENPELLSE